MTTNTGFQPMARLSKSKKKPGGSRNIGIDGAGKPQHGLAHHLGRNSKRGKA